MQQDGPCTVRRSGLKVSNIQNARSYMVHMRFLAQDARIFGSTAPSTSLNLAGCTEAVLLRTSA